MGWLPFLASSRNRVSSHISAAAANALYVEIRSHNFWPYFATLLVDQTTTIYRHNLGLLHANQGPFGDEKSQYRDFTGYMSGAKAEYIKFDYPVQCFNGGNHWELGWYESNPQRPQPHVVEVFPDLDPSLVYIGAFADRDKFANQPGLQEYAVVKVGDYYLQYNGQWGINRDTNEAGNQLTVTRDWLDGTYIVGKVPRDPGTQWTLPGEIEWSIHICARAEGSDIYADVLTVWIGIGDSPNCDGDGIYVADIPNTPCKSHFETCLVDDECCSGHCTTNGNKLVCLPNPDAQVHKNQLRISSFSPLRKELALGHQRRRRGVRGL